MTHDDRQLDRIGPYRVEGELGRGGMGAVLRVRHVETGAPYALKLIRSRGEAFAATALTRFRREAEALARVEGHPGIVRIHAFRFEGATPYCVMELVEGRSLAAVLAQGALDPREGAMLVASIAEAVAWAHGHGVVHRDLKPANVLIDASGRARVTDFGLAYDVQADTFTRTGEMLGTPSYMAPEQVHRRPGNIDVRTDVYGLGAILYEALTGRVPFEGQAGLSLIRAVVLERPRSLREIDPAIPAELEIICLRALEKRPDDRFASASALADDLGRWLRGDRIASRPGSVLGRRLRSLRRRPALLALGAMLLPLVAGFAATAISWDGSRRRARARKEAGERFDRSFERVLAGDASGIEEARDAIAALTAATGDDPVRSERLARLDRFLAGDPELLASVELDTPPWRGRERGLLELLAREERWDEIVAYVEPRRRVLADAASARIVARAVLASGVARRRGTKELAPLLRRVAATLGPEAPTADAGDVRLGAEVLMELLPGLLASWPSPHEDDLLGVCRILAPLLRDRRVAPTDAARAAVGALSEGWAEDARDPSVVETIIQIAGEFDEATFSIVMSRSFGGLPDGALGDRAWVDEQLGWAVVLVELGADPDQVAAMFSSSLPGGSLDEAVAVADDPARACLGAILMYTRDRAAGEEVAAPAFAHLRRLARPEATSIPAWFLAWLAYRCVVHRADAARISEEAGKAFIDRLVRRAIELESRRGGVPHRCVDAVAMLAPPRPASPAELVGLARRAWTRATVAGLASTALDQRGEALGRDTVRLVSEALAGSASGCPLHDELAELEATIEVTMEADGILAATVDAIHRSRHDLADGCRRLGEAFGAPRSVHPAWYVNALAALIGDGHVELARAGLSALSAERLGVYRADVEKLAERLGVEPPR